MICGTDQQWGRGSGSDEGNSSVCSLCNVTVYVEYPACVVHADRRRDCVFGAGSTSGPAGKRPYVIVSDGNTEMFIIDWLERSNHGMYDLKNLFWKQAQALIVPRFGLKNQISFY